MQNKPLVITHRGDCENGIENTVHAVQLAIDQGANGIEIDIRQTRDGEIVVFHDFSLRRLLNQPGYVGKSDLRDLQQLPYANPFNDKKYVIETLESFLDSFGKKYPINLDAKTIHFFDFKFAEQIIGIIRNQDLFEHVWISCFNPFLLQILKLKNKRIRTGYLFQRTTWIHTLYDMIAYSDAWHPHYRVLNSYLMRKAERYNKEIFVWTVNDEKAIRKVQAYPVNGIITDNVTLVKSRIPDFG